MGQRFTLSIILLLIMSLTLMLQKLYFSHPRSQSAYLLVSVIWICGISLLLISASYILSRYFAVKNGQNPETLFKKLDRRGSFRIVYPIEGQPTLVINNTDGNSKRNLEFPIFDLSQGGCCFIDDGSLGVMEKFWGHIRFCSGKQTQVAGNLLRKSGERVSVAFSNSIDWSVLLDEQRRLLSQSKDPSGCPHA